MNKKKLAKQRNKEQRLLMEKKKKLQTEELEEIEPEEMLLEEDAPLTEEEESLLGEEAPEAVSDEPQTMEEINKEYYGEYAMAGATSWEQMDAQKEAEEQAHHVRMATYDVQNLVRNILISDMEPEEKAGAIEKVGSGFGPRVKGMMGMMDKERDMDLLELESIIAKDNRQTGVMEKAMDWIAKAKLTSQARNALPAGEFALPGKKKYPIHDKAHVRNALSRAAQQMKKGGTGAADAKAALPKIRAAAKKMGIGMSKESGILITKDAQGDYRWIGWPTNNFIDHSGDIITEAAHQDYVDWVNKDLAERAPVFTSCHAPGTARENPVDFVGYENGFMVMSGKLTEGEAAALMKMQKEADIGMSHTAWGLREGNDAKLITKYRIFEVTDLPLETADNPFTTMEIFAKEADMDQLEYLTGLLGSKEKAEQALSLKTSLKQKELDEAQVESKEKEEPSDQKPVISEQKPTPPDLTAIIKQMEEQFGMKELSETMASVQKELEKVPVLESLVKDLLTKQDEKLAEVLTPPAGKFSWMSKTRASQKEETVVKEDEPLAKKGPHANWMTDALNITPVSIEEEHPAVQ